MSRHKSSEALLQFYTISSVEESICSLPHSLLSVYVRTLFPPSFRAGFHTPQQKCSINSPYPPVSFPPKLRLSGSLTRPKHACVRKRGLSRSSLRTSLFHFVRVLMPLSRHRGRTKDTSTENDPRPRWYGSCHSKLGGLITWRGLSYGEKAVL